MYQQGTRLYMPIRLTGADLDDVSSIEFMFKQTKDMTDVALKSALWVNGDENSTAFRTEDNDGNDVIAIPWTLDETYLFKGGRFFYVHARIHLTGTDANPPVRIVSVVMSETLFNQGEEVTE